MIALLDVTPEELRDTERQRWVVQQRLTGEVGDSVCRETALSLPEVERRGEAFLRALYGETANYVQTLLEEIYPDMGTHSTLLESVLRGF